MSYLNARYYDGQRGQFTSQDPVFWEVGDSLEGVATLYNPQLQNSYSYGANNPIINKDPTGRFILQVLAMLFMPSVAYSPDIGEENQSNVPLETSLFVAGFVSPGGSANKVVNSADDVARGLAKGTNYGKLGTVVDQEITQVTGYTKHGLDRKISRGVPTSEIVNTVRNPGVVLKQSGGTFLNVGNNAAVVVNKNGKVVTTYSKNDYNKQLQSIERQLRDLQKQVDKLVKENKKTNK